MEVAALIFSAVALATSVIMTRRQLTLARHNNSLPVLIDLFREHRTARLFEARQFVHNGLPKYDVRRGYAGLPERERELVRDLACYYDNLGALVLHEVVDVELVAGYLGGSVVAAWKKLRPLIEAERQMRAQHTDPRRWQEYFENLALLMGEVPPNRARGSRALWRLA
ncbi:DUF4760 domain-containing protein [Micromonospora purpureochromogenes]|uniref:DUF4760 domain-containing protein n=1 Tax=Micromonospora purpureochromogenes TaxID=47872 RepID=UPI003F4D2D6B